MTRGVHLGYQRNYFAVQVDDVFLPDSRWSATGHCTPGDGCADPTLTTPDIRMTPTDVANLVAWQNANGFKLDMVFNGGGSDLWKADQIPPATVDPTLDAFTAAGTENQFTWINHTYTHEFLGCIQVAPTVAGETWHCATPADTGPYFDPDLVPTKETLVDGIRWMSQAEIESQIQQNQAWATAHHLTNFDPTQLVTGEHSGLKTLPQQPDDSPFLAGAFADTGIAYTASDASREPASRLVGSTTTVPAAPDEHLLQRGDIRRRGQRVQLDLHERSGRRQRNLHRQPGHQHLHHAAAGRDTGRGPSQLRQLHQADRSPQRIGVRPDQRPAAVLRPPVQPRRRRHPLSGRDRACSTSTRRSTTPRRRRCVHLDLKGQGQALTQMDTLGERPKRRQRLH